jgi:peptidoglycan/LPS O-acetylase OafA/YrhL
MVAEPAGAHSMVDGPQSKQRYSSGLDGLRAICALSVLAFHSEPRYITGGFLGVDVFFVISGFLITRNLAFEYGEVGKINFLGFYVRRARRLLPALSIALLLACVLWPRNGPSYAQSAIATLFYYANWKYLIDGGASLGCLVHAWSLSIEEQFYLLWPVTLAFILRKVGKDRRAVNCTIALIVLLSAARAIAAAFESPLAEYPSTLARMDQILVGAALGLVPSRASGDSPNHSWTGAVAFGGLVAVAFIAGAHPRWMQFGGLTLVALLAGAVVRDVADPNQGVLSRLLSWSPLVAIGKRSYGFYLFHYPLVTWIGALRRPGVVNLLGVLVLRVSATLGLAWLSYRLVETPFLRLTPKATSSTS